MNNNQSILLRLEHLENKMQQLVEKYQALKKELDITTEENYSLKELVKKQTVQINNFENQYKISKIVASIAPDAEDAAELREKIDAYITDIDKCITFLSK
jgi:chromosome segregation ATPase